MDYDEDLTARFARSWEGAREIPPDEIPPDETWQYLCEWLNHPTRAPFIGARRRAVERLRHQNRPADEIAQGLAWMERRGLLPEQWTEDTPRTWTEQTPDLWLAGQTDPAPAADDLDAAVEDLQS